MKDFREPDWDNAYYAGCGQDAAVQYARTYVRIMPDPDGGLALHVHHRNAKTEKFKLVPVE